MIGLDVAHPSAGDLVAYVIAVAVVVASWRRSRCLSRYSVGRGVVIALLAGAFWPIWIVASVVNRRRLAWEWDERRARARHTHQVVPAPGTR